MMTWKQMCLSDPKYNIHVKYNVHALYVTTLRFRRRKMMQI